MPEAQKSSIENMSQDERDNLAALAHTMANDPATRHLFLRMTKKISPNTPIPEVDIADSVNAALKTRDDKIASLEKNLLENEAKGNIEKRRSDLKGQGFSSDEVENMEKWMVENNVPNYKTAADFFKMQKQSAPPTPHSINSTMELPKNALEVYKKGGKRELNNLARSQASQAIDDIRAGRVKFA